MDGFGGAAARFLYLLPALLLALLCLRVAELGAGVAAGSGGMGAAQIVAMALVTDVFALARHLPLLFLYSLPLLLIRSRRGVFWGLGLAWTLLVVVQAALVQYFLVARVPLGADLFAYSAGFVGKTVAAGLRIDMAVVLGVLVGLLCLWSVLAWLFRRRRFSPTPRVTALVFGTAVAALAFLPGQRALARSETEDAYSLSLNKAAFFFDDNIAYLTRSRATVAAPAVAAPGAAPPGPVVGFHYLDPRYPFLRAEQTPDALGPHFLVHANTPPNLVFVLVEGLGRSFSGPGAELGSFTPFLDQLGDQSLYWDNFLAVQGRTFGALPSIFGSLPFGDQGFSALGNRMPAHLSLLSVLKDQGYRVKFYTGTDPDFNNEGAFLQRQGVDVLLGEADFGPGYPRSPGSESWGYADNELVSLALADQARDARQPYVAVLNTVTMHTPYTFPGQEAYDRRFEQRLDQLGVSALRKSRYRAYRGIYTSVMYLDDALRRYFEQAKKWPSYANTIFIVTGDHRLPEIPMSLWIDRYHVPLIIYSPLLKAPARIKSVSSHFDLAPSLLSFLSHNYGIRTPQAVTWIGSGLDLEPTFRSTHEFPMKQTMTNLVDFVSGPWFLNRGSLYSLGDGMATEPVRDAAALARVQARFAAFNAANNQFAHSLALMPAGSSAHFTVNMRPKPSVQAATDTELTVREVRSPGHARAGELAIDVVFANAGAAQSRYFHPLVVLATADGREISESYGKAVAVAGGQTITVRLSVKSESLPAGRYFLSVLLKDPQSDKPLGVGRFRIPIRIDS